MWKEKCLDSQCLLGKAVQCNYWVFSACTLSAFPRFSSLLGALGAEFGPFQLHESPGDRIGFDHSAGILHVKDGRSVNCEMICLEYSSFWPLNATMKSAKGLEGGHSQIGKHFFLIHNYFEEEMTTRKRRALTPIGFRICELCNNQVEQTSSKLFLLEHLLIWGVPEALIASFSDGMQWKATLFQLIPLRQQALSALRCCQETDALQPSVPTNIEEYI